MIDKLVSGEPGPLPEEKALSGEPCRATRRKDTCFATGSLAEAALRNGIGRRISRDESLSILEENQKEGLVLQPSNSETAEFICSCCGCCCGMLACRKACRSPWISGLRIFMRSSLRTHATGAAPANAAARWGRHACPRQVGKPGST